MKKYILTGGEGNLGSHLRKACNLDFITIMRDNWDILDSLPAHEIEGVIHCAYDLKKDLFEYPTEVLNSNITSTGKLLDFCKKKKVNKFIFASSCAVYGDSSNSNEDKQTHPISMNGFIKSFNEELIKKFCINNNMKYLIFRIFNSYGGDDHFSVVQKMIRCAKEKTPFILVNEGLDERDFIYINDVAQIISKIIAREDLANQAINIGTGQSAKIIDILRAVEEKFGPIQLIRKSNDEQIVYSRANTTKLKQLIDYKPINIFDHIRCL